MNIRKLQVSASTSGFSLLEALVGACIGAILTSAVASTLKLQIIGTRNNAITATRNSLQALATRYIQDQTALHKSAKYRNTNSLGNVAFDYCLNGPPAAPTADCPAGVFPNCCQATATNTSQPFILLDPADPTWTRTFSGTVSAASPLAVTTASPQRYDVDMKSCATANEVCRFEITTSFISSCPGLAARCSTPAQVNVQYDLRQTPVVTLAGTAAPPLRNLNSGPINVLGGAGKILGMVTYNNPPPGIATPGQPSGWIPFAAASSGSAMGLTFTVSDPSEVFLFLGRGRFAAGGLATAIGYQVTHSTSYDPTRVVEGGHWGTSSADVAAYNGCDPTNPIVCRQFFASGWSYFTGYPAGTYTVWLMGYDARAGDRLYLYDRQLMIYQLR